MPDELEQKPKGKTESCDEQPPALVESLLVIALLTAAAISCWMIYGPLIRLMPEYMRQIIR